jgi:hypothetical protein
MANNTVIVKGDPIYKEAKAASGGILPGHLITFDSAGDVIQNATDADADAARMFAIENRDIGEGLTDTYADNDQVHYIVPRAGDEILALIAASENITIGESLSSAGGGELKSFTGTGTVIGFALAATNVTSVARIAIAVA